jgi:hypothetical protein
MLKHLTTLFVDHVMEPGVYTDTDSPRERGAKGLSLRVRRSKKTYSVQYRNAAGRKLRLTLGDASQMSLKDARKAASDAHAQVRVGQDPATAKREARGGETVADLAALYLKEYAKKKKDHGAGDARYLEKDVLPHLGHRSVRDLARKDIRHVLKIAGERGTVLPNRVLSVISKMFNYGLSEDYPGLNGNPAGLIGKAKEQKRTRVLSDHEIRLMWAACAIETPEMCALHRLQLVTAQRAADLRGLQWTDLELPKKRTANGAGWLTVPAAYAKNGRAHRVPLFSLAQDIIAALPHRDRSPYLFPGRAPNLPLHAASIKKISRNINHAVTERLREIDLAAAPFYYQGKDLRRTAGTNMTKHKTTRTDLGKVLNHKDKNAPEVTETYDLYEYDEQKLAALGTWDRNLRAILKAKPVAPFSQRPRRMRPPTVALAS